MQIDTRSTPITCVAAIGGQSKSSASSLGTSKHLLEKQLPQLVRFILPRCTILRGIDDCSKLPGRFASWYSLADSAISHLNVSTREWDTWSTSRLLLSVFSIRILDLKHQIARCKCVWAPVPSSPPVWSTNYKVDTSVDPVTLQLNNKAHYNLLKKSLRTCGQSHRSLVDPVSLTDRATSRNSTIYHIYDGLYPTSV